MSKSNQHSSINALNTGEYDFDNILSRFKKINNTRLQRSRETLTDRQKEFFTLLPLLFHINHPSLTGFVSSKCPIGIPGYNPSKEAKFLAKRIAKGYTYKHQSYQQYDILSIFFMGSPGTIAYSQGSDFDIWLCYRYRT